MTIMDEPRQETRVSIGDTAIRPAINVPLIRSVSRRYLPSKLIERDEAREPRVRGKIPPSRRITRNFTGVSRPSSIVRILVGRARARTRQIDFTDGRRQPAAGYLPVRPTSARAVLLRHAVYILWRSYNDRASATRELPFRACRKDLASEHAKKS